ncbi:hypothetical protein TNCV_521781 [Trichonephila clavipes]|nr:hypothetical protein TNCV_521781 [Trichonephila clavipes]
MYGVTVWGAISWDTRSSLVVLQGTLTARRYVDDIFNADCATHAIKSPRCHLSNRIMLVHILRDSSQQCLQGYDVLPWPARSTDL